ncbi:putative bifunctional diguanylate cyclase/phosphodiesterase [Aeromicrobium endophyticum]|uniref:Bifunctional diguanylate cyclase/phosphodiesterase n=1 Tax=Aeromicrobium endophyticum TaxID=2292704 RepID=A0A371P3I3_9ACTN|nr:bifunctional diguanylate cyclase/phosphodiesterase [Aeromicrobium endophyticum]REK70507.1 bifunctional diguanylate cyclase/phosphodiesterase [Aeromicrobium endophyticum]
MRTPWRVYATAASLAVVAYFAMPSGRVADALYVAIGVSCVVAIVVGTRVQRPSSVAPWLVLAAGQATWVGADAVYSWLEATDSLTHPSAADALYLGSYPLLAAGVALLMRAQRRSRDVAGLVDTAIVTTGFVLLYWAFIAGPLLDDRSGTDLGLAVSLAYPAVDLVLIALLLRLVTGQYAWSPSFLMLIAAMATSLTADALYATGPTGGVSSIGLDVLWLASYVLWGTAALHPDMAVLTRPAPRGRTPFTAGRLALLGVAVVLPVVLLALQPLLDLEIDHLTLVVASVVMSLLVMARMACDIDEIRATAHQRDTLRADLFHRATHDHVTGVANRPYILEQITAALERGLRDGTPSALIDVRVGGVDELLRETGFRHRDEALRAVADRIGHVVQSDDCVARLGPDEFVVLIDRLGPDANLAGVARELLDAIAAPLHLGGRPVGVTAAVGISVSLDGSTDADALLHEARVAAGAAVERGDRGDEPVEFFAPSLRREQDDRIALEAALVDAIAHDELEVHYQPVVAVGTGVLDGYEALVRWNRPGHGLLQPDAFVPVAEKSDLICALDRWVLHEAARQLVAWTEEDPIGAADLTVAVNVSGRHLASATIVADVAAALHSSGLRPERLTVEVTETVLVDVPRASLQMSALRRLGVSISIDDFGTGYTSIGHLGALPADILKIDRSLVMSTGPGATELLALIVQAGHAHGLLVVAEGVEQQQRLDDLRDLRYDSAQGYLFARPLAADDVRTTGPRR